MFTFIETKLFSRLVRDYLSDDEYSQVQLELIRNPELGAMVRGSGGVRKFRWKAAGRGKRSGYRLIYFIHRPNSVIWMLTIYPKNMRDSIPGHVLRQIRQEIENEQS